MGIEARIIEEMRRHLRKCSCTFKFLYLGRNEYFELKTLGAHNIQFKYESPEIGVIEYKGMTVIKVQEDSHLFIGVKL